MNWLMTAALLAVSVAVAPASFGAGMDSQPGLGLALAQNGHPAAASSAQDMADFGDVLVPQGDTVQLSGTALSARTLIGATVVDQDDKKVGAIDDLVLDRDNKVTKIIITNGSVFGLGGKTLAMTYDGSAIIHDRNSARTPHLRLARDALDRVAEIDKTKISGDGERLASSYLDRAVVLADADSGGGDAAGRAKGEVQDLLLNRDGAVKYAVVDFGGFLDVGSNQVVVRIGTLAAAPQGRPMILAMTETQVKAAPKFHYRDGGMLGTGGK